MSDLWIVRYLDLNYNEATDTLMSGTESDLEIAWWVGILRIYEPALWRIFEFPCSTLQMSTRWQSTRMCTHLLLELQNYNSLLNSHQKENVGSHPKKIPHVQGQRRNPKKMVGRAKSHLVSNSIPARDSKDSNKTLCVPGPRDPTRDWATSAIEYLSVFCRGTGQQWPP